MLNLIAKSIDTLRHGSISEFLVKVKNKFAYWYEKWTFRSYITTRKVGDIEIKVLIGDLFAQSCYGNQENLNNWEEIFWIQKNLLEEGDIVADCGANIGFVSIFFSHYIGSDGHIFGFEALPHNTKIANQNIELNNVSNFSIHNFALGSHRGVVKFIDVPNGSVGEIKGLKSIDVTMISLDEFFADNQHKKPTFIKLDVEGYEIEVLKGATECLKGKPKLDIEIHCSYFDNPLEKVSELLEILPLEEYHQVYLQLTPNGKIELFDIKDISASLISKYSNVHLFAIHQKSSPK